MPYLNSQVAQTSYHHTMPYIQEKYLVVIVYLTPDPLFEANFGSLSGSIIPVR